MTREEKAKETKQKIISSSRILIKEKGLANVSVDEITKLAGVSKGSFYVYYKRKEDILNDVAYLHFQKLKLDTIAMKTDIKDKLKYYMISFMDTIVDEGIEMCSSWIKTVTDINNIDSSKYEFDVNSLLEIFESEKYSISEAQVLTNIINTELYGIVFSWCITNAKFDYKKAILEYCENVLIKLL